MTWTLPVEEDEDGNCFITLPDDLLKEAGWKEGDMLEWIDNNDGSFSLVKPNDDSQTLGCNE